MQIPSFNPLTLSQSLLAKVNAGTAASSATASQTAIAATTATPTTSSPAESAFAATLAANGSATMGLGSVSPSDVPAYISRQPIAAYGRPAFQYALSHGGVNPAEWLSPSDISLFEKTTGGTIKDGVIYDKNGVANGSQANADLVFALCRSIAGPYW